MRKRYYCPTLDNEDYKEISESDLLEPTVEHPANLLSSLCDNGLHSPALDIDIHAELLPSSTPGHFHLYFTNLHLTWEKYAYLLQALAHVGILEQSYVDHSLRQKQTLLRPPGLKKKKKTQ